MNITIKPTSYTRGICLSAVIRKGIFFAGVFDNMIDAQIDANSYACILFYTPFMQRKTIIVRNLPKST